MRGLNVTVTNNGSSNSHNISINLPAQGEAMNIHVDSMQQGPHNQAAVSQELPEGQLQPAVRNIIVTAAMALLAALGHGAATGCLSPTAPTPAAAAAAPAATALLPPLPAQAALPSPEQAVSGPEQSCHLAAAEQHLQNGSHPNSCPSHREQQQVPGAGQLSVEATHPLPAAADSAFACSSLEVGQEVVLHCLAKPQDTWQLSGEQIRLQVVTALGCGGSGEVYCVQLVPSSNQPGQHKQGSSQRTHMQQGVGTAGGAAVAAAPTAVAAAAVGSKFLALKTARAHYQLPEAVRQDTPAQEFYSNCYNALQLEYEITCSLAKHANIVNTYAYGHMVYMAALGKHSVEMQLPAMLMQLSMRGSVEHMLEQLGTGLDPETAWCVISDTASALAALHRTGVVYEDVKPSNIVIMIDEHTGIREFTLVDFNSCSRLGPDGLVRVACVGGTPGYMSPEAYAAKPHGVQADSWSLGCLLLELRTGQVPWPHLADLPEHEAAARRTYAEVLACPVYQCLDPNELAFLAKALQQDQQQRPTVQQLMMDEAYMFCGPVCVVEDMAREAAYDAQMMAARKATAAATAKLV